MPSRFFFLVTKDAIEHRERPSDEQDRRNPLVSFFAEGALLNSLIAIRHLALRPSLPAGTRQRTNNLTSKENHHG